MSLSKDAVFNLVAKDKTKKAFTAAGKGMRALKERSLALTSSLKGIGIAAATVAGPAALGALVSSSLESVSSLAEISDRLGLTTKELASLQHASEITGAGTKTLNMALQRMTRRIAEAAAGTGEAKGALIELGLSAEELSLESPAIAFRKIAGAMEKTEKQSDKVRLAMKLFDSEGVALVNTLALGEKGLQDIAKEAERFGLAISRTDASKIEFANTAMIRFKSSIVGAGRAITVALAPALTVIANRFITSGNVAEVWGEITQSAIEGIAHSLAILKDGFNGLKILWKTLELAFAGLIAGISTGFNILTGDLLAIASYIPFIGDGIGEANETISHFAEQARGTVSDLAGELKELIDAPSANSEVELFLQEIRDAALEAENAVAGVGVNVNKLSTLPGGEDGGGEDGLTEEDRINRKIDQLSILEQIEAESLGRRGNFKKAALTHEFGMNISFFKQMFAAGRKHELNMLKLKNSGLSAQERFLRKSWKSQVSTVANSLIQMTSSVAGSNKAMFAINKVASLANAGLNIAQGITKALATYPPPLSFAMAGAQAAAGLIQLNNIRSQSFGSGSPPSVTSGGSFGSDSEFHEFKDFNATDFDSDGDDEGVQEAKKQINITLDGNPSPDQIRELIQAINEEVGNGTELVVT